MQLAKAEMVAVSSKNKQTKISLSMALAKAKIVAVQSKTNQYEVSLSKKLAKVKFEVVSSKKKRGKRKKSPRGEETECLMKRSLQPISISINIPRHELEDRITGIWKEAWFGLYEVHLARCPRSHSHRLQTLYLGAGLGYAPKVYTRIFESSLDRYFARRWDNGIASLKLCDELCVFTLHAIYEVLVEYQKEITPLRRLYALLERKQLRMTADGPEIRSPFETDVLVHDFNRIARPMAKTLASIETRTNEVNKNIEEELKDYRDRNGRSAVSKYIYEMEFPER
jgi:hypothetical protein